MQNNQFLLQSRNICNWQLSTKEKSATYQGEMVVPKFLAPKGPRGTYLYTPVHQNTTQRTPLHRQIERHKNYTSRNDCVLD